MATKSIKYDDKNFDISYEIQNPSNKNDLIILHGWGSNKEVMKKGFDSFSDFRLIYIDMPGFGNSSNEYILHTTDYANILNIFLETINATKELIAGHSFGGKVATLLNPKTLILLSSAGILEEKPLLVKTKIKTFKIFKRFFGNSFYKLFASKDVENMQQNMYETFKNVVDEDFSSYFEKFDNRALIFWGIDDTATTLKSGETISKLIKNSEFFPLNGNHYFFLERENRDFIKQTIKDKCCN
jgi:pimeloyl-ACP methyl ester carboxylesterase